MSGIDRIDRVIGIVLLVVLAALVGVGSAENSHATTPAAAGPVPEPAASSGAGPTEADRGSGAVATTSTTTVPPSPTAAPTTTAPSSAPPVPGPVTAVGDSLMLDIGPELSADVPGVSVDGLVSRQFEAGIAVVQADRAAGTLGRVLVVELGTNGAVTDADVDAMMQAAQGVARVVFVNVDVPRPWTAADNAVLAAGVARYPGVAVLADWYTLSSPHPEWFTADQVHLNPDGAAALAALIARYA